MARVLDEKLEAVGYDVAGWAETVGAGCTVDEDAASSLAGSPTGWGSKCLNIIKAAGADAYTQQGSLALVDNWVRIEILITSETLGNSEAVPIASAYDATDGKALWNLYLYQKSTGELIFYVDVYLNGSAATFSADTTVLSLNTRYRIEIQWDVTNDLFAWKVNGTQVSSNALTAGHATHLTRFRIGCFWSAARSATLYYDLIAIDNADWVGAEAGLSIPVAMRTYRNLRT